MNNWHLHFKKGKSDLANHKDGTALKHFQQALEECPPGETRSLSKILFYTGVVLKKVGSPNGAMKSWILARKVSKDPVCTEMIKRNGNHYGMTKQCSDLMDDWKAFHSIQMESYLKMKREQQFQSGAEKDVVDEIIADGWEEVCRNYPLDILSVEEKIELFRIIELDLPVMKRPEVSSAACIEVNFAQKRRFADSDTCPCGSGLPYRQCCGRIKGEDEIIFGS